MKIERLVNHHSLLHDWREKKKVIRHDTTVFQVTCGMRKEVKRNIKMEGLMPRWGRKGSPRVLTEMEEDQRRMGKGAL